MPYAGLAHVATASFLASRVTPSGGFAVALAGGVAIARAAERGGLRRGWGTSSAALLQTVAIMGPARIGVPLTQAVSAPVLGRMEARGRGVLSQAVAAAAVRLAHNALGTWLYVWLILGLDAYIGTYDRLLGWLPVLPEGRAGALAATLLALAVWTVGASLVQVLVYRRGLRRWPAEGTPLEADVPPPGDEAAGAPGPVRTLPPPPRPRFDPRAVVLAAVVAFSLLVASTAWPLLIAVAVWLAAAWALARGESQIVRPGLILAALLAGGALVAGLVGGLGIDVTLRRAVRAGLLVLVATWLRSAAGEDGLREVFRRTLHRARRVPLARETSDVLDGLSSTDALAASGRRLLARLRDVPGQPLPIADAVLDWVSGEAGRHPATEPAPARALRARAPDGVLVLLATATALALPLAG